MTLTQQQRHGGVTCLTDVTMTHWRPLPDGETQQPLAAQRRKHTGFPTEQQLDPAVSGGRGVFTASAPTHGSTSPGSPLTARPPSALPAPRDPLLSLRRAVPATTGSPRANSTSNLIGSQQDRGSPQARSRLSRPDGFCHQGTCGSHLLVIVQATQPVTYQGLGSVVRLQGERVCKEAKLRKRN